MFDTSYLQNLSIMISRIVHASLAIHIQEIEAQMGIIRKNDKQNYASNLEVLSITREDLACFGLQKAFDEGQL